MAKILVPVDGSPQSLGAVAVAVQLAQLLHARATLASVVDTTGLALSAGQYVPPIERIPEWRADVERDLRGPWSAPLRDAGIPVDIQVEEGSPSEVLVRMAQELRPDFVVVGNRGRGSVRQMFLGSVSHALTLHAPCPVVVVPQAAATVPSPESEVAASTRT